ncbi:MAG: hypothetical protein AUI14_09800 [Actinobacteria bacterium 13_2_20CM_2_71_6]|nr:MAG: hypothetical protein AUI14_09800 [Actinobacteria bacterium 13_2_20CM_2_71_6]
MGGGRRTAAAPEWFTFAERVEVLDGDGVGQRQRQHGRWGKRSAEVDREITEYDAPRLYGWRHVAERLDGKPAPMFARSTRFQISLEPAGTGTLVRLRSAQEPASAVKGLVMRAFGTREIGSNMDRSLERLAALFSGS